MKIEQIISELLRRHPKIRRIVKLLYQYVMYSIAKVSNINQVNMVKEYNITHEQGEYFFGYYDKSPWNAKENYILALKVPFADRHPINGEQAIIGIIEIDGVKSKSFEPLLNTKTWNLQQGAMLQWLGPKYDKEIIFNDCIDNNYVSIIYNLLTKEKRVLELPIYSVSKDGTKAISLNFSRLHHYRPGYGYSNISDKVINEYHPTNDGIWALDIKNNTSKLVISLDQIVKINHNPTMDNAYHRFNHLEINPLGNRFMFLHRWEYKNITYSRLFTADMEGEDIYCLAEDQMISHCCWKNDNTILSWSRKNEIGDRYYLYTDKTNEFKIVGDGLLTVDGHPSYSPDGRYLLTDTYPDKVRNRSLIIYDTYENKKYDIGKYFAPFKYDGDIRCDLHPRWSRDGGKISFDSVHEGKRKMYVVKNPFYKSK